MAQLLLLMFAERFQEQFVVALRQQLPACVLESAAYAATAGTAAAAPLCSDAAAALAVTLTHHKSSFHKHIAMSAGRRRTAASASQHMATGASHSHLSTTQKRHQGLLPPSWPSPLRARYTTSR